MCWRGQNWHLKKGSKATYVEYWYPYDLKDKKALTWEQYKQQLRDGRSETEFKLSTHYTAVFNACDIEGMPELPAVQESDITPDELIGKPVFGCIEIAGHARNLIEIHTQRAATSSPTRAALIEKGEYTARSWIVAWPRAALIRWPCAAR